MPSMLDIFNQDPFRVLSMTAAINDAPRAYMRLGEMGLFRPVPVTTRDVAIISDGGSLNLLPTRPVGGTPSYGTIGKKSARNLSIPHIPHNDTVYAADVQNRLAAALMNGGNVLMSAMDLVNEKLAVMRGKHDQTAEFFRWGALNGNVLDADGSSIVNYYTEFGISQTTIAFDLDVNTTDVEGKALDAKEAIEDALPAGTMANGYHAFCSKGFFRALLAHDAVVKYRTQFRGTTQLGQDYRNQFEYMGITFEQVVGSVKDADGNTRKFIADDTALVFPLGTDLFHTYNAPADFIETVNMPGLPMYAKQKVLDFDRGIEIHTQSNPLPVSLRPKAVVKLTLT